MNIDHVAALILDGQTVEMSFDELDVLCQAIDNGDCDIAEVFVETIQCDTRALVSHNFM